MKTAKSFILIALVAGSGAMQPTRGDTITVEPDGKVTFSPPFSMSHHEDPYPELPMTSVTYTIDDPTNGPGQVSFMGTTALWMVPHPSTFTNRVTTISELKQLIDACAAQGPQRTNISDSIIKFHGQDAVEGIGYFGNAWHDEIIMYWGEPKKRNDNAIFVIDSQATKKEICQALVAGVTVAPPKGN
ncbi:MAG TPA: hypothetical protein VMH87_05290 [Pseudomonadales bacterium]|nr:hypothetical protein [Pseudomonadales bacterium]